MKFKKKKAIRICAELASAGICMENSQIKINPTKLGEHSMFRISERNIKKYKDLKIDNNCDLMKIKSEYFIYVAVPVAKEPLKIPETFCGIDPGLRTFMTVYSNHGIYEYNQCDEPRLQLNLKINLLKNRKCLKKKHKKSRVKKCAISKREERRSNLTDELHWTVINDLVRKNDLILYGDIKSHDIVKDGKNKFNNKRFNDTKFYVFKQRLMYKALRSGKKVIPVCERYTTKGCSKCGNVKHDVGSNKTYYCDILECAFVHDRDINSSKNIMMKGMIPITG